MYVCIAINYNGWPSVARLSRRSNLLVDPSRQEMRAELESVQVVCFLFVYLLMDIFGCSAASNGGMGALRMDILAHLIFYGSKIADSTQMA